MTTSLTLHGAPKLPSEGGPRSQSLDLNGPATWELVAYWSGLAANLSHASIAAQVMAGFALADLHKKHNIKPGNPHPETGRANQLPNDSGIDQPDSSRTSRPSRDTWADLVKQNAGVSEDTARNWIKMAEGIKAKWKKLCPQDKIRQLMSVPVAEWTEKQIADVQSAVQKATDGMTQAEFLRELGLAKKAPGNPNGKGGKKKKLSISEEAALRAQQASEDWAEITRLLDVYADKFVLLPNHDVLAQYDVLERALKARRKWTTQTPGQRDPKIIAEIFRTK